MSRAETIFEKTIREALQELRGQATLGDVVAATGLPTLRVEVALRELLERCRGHLAVDENGELLYLFPWPLIRRRGWGEWLREKVSQWIGAVGRALAFLFKLWIMAVLVAYTVVFGVLALIFMLSSLSEILLSFIDLPFYLWAGGAGGESYPCRASPPSRPFWRCVFAYVFGEEDLPPTPRFQDRQVLDFLRQHAGRMTAADFVALTGAPLMEAEEEMARLLVKYNGDVEVTEQGTLVYTFEALMPSLNRRRASADRAVRVQGVQYGPPQTVEPIRQEPAKWSFYWERTEERIPLNRNPAGTNGWITGLNLFNLVVATGCLFHFAGKPHLVLPLGVFPLLFSLLFFLVPALRWGFLQRENAARRRRNQHRQVLRYLFEGFRAGPVEQPLYPSWMGSHLAPSPGNRAEVEALLEQFRRDYDGEIHSDANGELYYTFPRLREEWADGQDARQRLQPDPFQIGPVVYSSAQA